MKHKDFFIQLFCWVMLVLVIISPAILSAKSIHGSGNQITIKESYTDFDEIEISHSFNARVNYGKEYGIIVRVDDNLKDYVIIEKRDNSLKIGMKDGHSYINSHLEVSVTMPDVRKLGLSGASSMVIDGFVFQHDLDLNLSGSSKVYGTIETGNIDLNLSGASDVTLKGKGENLDIHASGSSLVRMDDFKVNDAKLELSGASNCMVNIDGEMDVYASGSSKVKYCGKGELGSIEASGSSKVKRM
ncbi:MAG: DUF2807 domain-containing protein [Candidatus Marinimicrobia bacterium]|nr:DUF2807 domain-containing protein [Candidatus Neomarinimicrobiota bacterium]